MLCNKTNIAEVGLSQGFCMKPELGFHMAPASAKTPKFDRLRIRNKINNIPVHAASQNRSPVLFGTSENFVGTATPIIFLDFAHVVDVFSMLIQSTSI